MGKSVPVGFVLVCPCIWPCPNRIASQGIAMAEVSSASSVDSSSVDDTSSDTSCSTNDYLLPHPSEWADECDNIQMTDSDGDSAQENDEAPLSSSSKSLRSSFQADGEALERWLSSPNGGHHHYYSSSPDLDDLEQHKYVQHDLTVLMETDEQIGANLLGDDVFGGGCCSYGDGVVDIGTIYCDGGTQDQQQQQEQRIVDLGCYNDLSSFTPKRPIEESEIGRAHV